MWRPRSSSTRATIEPLIIGRWEFSCSNSLPARKYSLNYIQILMRHSFTPGGRGGAIGYGRQVLKPGVLGLIPTEDEPLTTTRKHYPNSIKKTLIPKKW